MAALTELEAVNAMLRQIGEQPVDILPSDIYEAQVAEQLLAETNRTIQSMGLECNSESGYPLERDADNEINIPEKVLSIDASSPYEQIVQRNGKLYDKKNHTFTLSKDYEVDIVWLLDFEELPVVVKTYVTAVAGRRLQEQLLGSEGLSKFQRNDEARALMRMTAEQLNVGDYSLFDNMPSQVLVNRRGNL